MRDVAPPPSGKGMVAVRVEQVSVCGTDRKVVDGSVPVTTPRVIGHELVGRVAGPTPAGRLRPGDRVLVDPSVSCGRCATCRRGLVHLCPEGGLMGRDVDGGMAELVVVGPGRAHPLPEGIGADDAALLQVLGTCVHALRDVPAAVPGHAAVVGLGVSGLLHVQLLRARGASSVLGVGRSPAKRALAEALGATATCSPDEAVDAIEATTGGDGARVVVEAVGSEPTIWLSVALAGFGAVVVVYGTVPGPGSSAPFSEMYRKELRLLHPRAALGVDYEEAIALTASGAVRAAPLVTDRVQLADAPDLFSSWADHPERLKAVVDLTG